MFSINKVVIYVSFFLVIAISSAKGQYVGESCTLIRDRSEGICTPLTDCPYAYNETSGNPQLCIFIHFEPVVCCPKTSLNQIGGSQRNHKNDQFDSTISNMDGEHFGGGRRRKNCDEYSNLPMQRFTFVPKNGPAYDADVPQCTLAVPLIVGGVVTRPKEFPHMAAIGWDGEDGTIDWKCGGVLISEEMVLTTASCTGYPREPAKYILLGDHNLVRSDDDADPQQFTIKEIIRHPDQKPTSRYNDIALMRIDGFPRLNRYVRPACLWRSANINYTEAVATGWGLTDFGGTRSDDLLKVTLDILPNSQCASAYGNIRQLDHGIADTQICAGYLEGGKDTCQGDSGGPIHVATPDNACLYHVIGLTSFGKSCAVANTPAIYTRVSSYLDWIEKITWPDEKRNQEDVDCGTVDLVNLSVPLVINGETIVKGTWPWLASIFTFSGPKLGFQCGGTLISRKVVLSAAHCFFGRNKRLLSVDDVLIVLGLHNLRQHYDKNAKTIPVESINIHEGYGKRQAIDSDIAVVVLTERVEFTSYIRPACLWKESFSQGSLVGLKGTVTGWGRDEFGNIYSELPKKVEIPVVSDEDCLKSNVAFSVLTSANTFCAGWRNGTEGPCNGDSGSGLLFRRNDKWVLRGIVSTALPDAKGNCNLNEYIIFMDIVNFMPWIESFVNSNDQ